jgi:hypothetical protein
VRITLITQIFISIRTGGSFKDPFPEQIIQARNNFIRDYKIVSYYEGTYRYMIEDPTSMEYDHKEYYRDQDGRVVQVYSQRESHGFDETFTKIAPMYNTGQFTAIKIIETTKSKNKRRRMGSD